MPEGPEVRITVDQLNQLVSNTSLQAININSGRYSKKNPVGFPEFQSQLPLKINSVNCKGKFIWFEISNGWYIFNTLGMSGGWKLKKEKHSHLTFLYDNKEIHYTDVRNFGTFKFVKDKKELDKKLKELGSDVLTQEYTLPYIKKVLHDTKIQNKTIVEVLMNQKKFCGIGNYLKSEILYECKISPHRLVKDLTNKDIVNIFENSKKIVLGSYNRGGGSSGNYTDLSNKKGTYHFELKVYTQLKDPLGHTIKKENTKDKRTTHWVPELQI